MYSWNDPDDRVAIVQMNADLRHTQLDLLSAQCSTDRLRLRFSAEDLARYGEKDVLRKTIGAAVALGDYYLAIKNELSADWSTFGESQVQQAVRRVAGYLRGQRETFLASGAPLRPREKQVLEPFFSSALLDRIRTVELHGRRLPPPPFYLEARAVGINNLPELTHMASVTFEDVIVFNDLIIERSLFHGLVHAAQFQILGLERYTDLFVRAFLRTNAHFTVPLETHACALESKFVLNPGKHFPWKTRSASGCGKDGTDERARWRVVRDNTPSQAGLGWRNTQRESDLEARSRKGCEKG